MKRSGEVVREFGTYWKVVRRPDAKRGEDHVVVDTSTDPPHQVYGPTTRKDADEWAHLTAALFAATHGQLPGPLEDR